MIDGAEGTDNLDLLILDDDTDYQLHPTVVTVQFDGFESHLHGVMEYKWAVGTTPGGEDVMSFIPYGLIHSEEVSVKGNGKSIFVEIGCRIAPEMEDFILFIVC